MIDTDQNNSSSTMSLTTVTKTLPHNHHQTPLCTSSSTRIADNTKKALLTDLGISPAGVLSSSSSSNSIVIDAIGVFEQHEGQGVTGGLPFEKENILEEVNDQDVKEKRRKNELLLDNFDSIVRTIYGYESREQKAILPADDSSYYDSDCESDYEDDDEDDE